MRNFAIVNSDDVVNNIVVSEEAGAVQLVFESTGRIVEESETTGISFIGATYRADVNKFVPFKLYDSWIFDENIWQWIAPVPKPEDDKSYYWNESELVWTELNLENI